MRKQMKAAVKAIPARRAPGEGARIPGERPAAPTRDTKCVKCGNTDIHVAWHKDESACTFEQRNYDRTSRVDEHLHYHCRCCSYDWTGETLDKQEAPK